MPGFPGGAVHAAGMKRLGKDTVQTPVRAGQQHLVQAAFAERALRDVVQDAEDAGQIHSAKDEQDQDSEVNAARLAQAQRDQGLRQPQ